MSRTIRSNDVSSHGRPLTHYEIDRLLSERIQRASTLDVVRYWRLMDRALELSLRDPARATHYANEARSIAVKVGRPDLAFNASEIASIVGDE
jgi:hypothetical protein